MLKLRAAILTTTLALVIPTMVASAAGTLVGRTDNPPPLIHSRTYTVQGTQLAGVCTFPQAPLAVPDGAAAIERRQPAVDDGNCLAVFEEGVPTAVPPAILPARSK